MDITALINVLRELAPEFNPAGLINCGINNKLLQNITNIGVCVDPTEANLQAALAQEMQLLITYHPWQGEAEQQVKDGEMGIIPLHTAWDVAPEGISTTLAQKLELNTLQWVDGVITGVTQITLRELIERCQRVLDLNVLPYYGELNSTVAKIAIWPGPGFLPNHKPILDLAVSLGCDTILSSELSLVPIRFAAAKQLKLVDLGHSVMARTGMLKLVELLNVRLAAVDCHCHFLEGLYAANYYTAWFFKEQFEMAESLPLFSLNDKQE